MPEFSTKELLNRHNSGAKVMRKAQAEEDARKGAFELTEDGQLVPREINGWDEFFNNMFGNPLQHPKHVKVEIRRLLPANHLLNPTPYDLCVPFMFTMTDKQNLRWLGYLYDSSLDDGGWRFLLMLPDPKVLLMYFAGKTELINVYKSAGTQMFLCQPDNRPTLIQTNYSMLPEEAQPERHSMYDANIWFDENDIQYGMNDVNSYEITALAKKGQFYPGDKDHSGDPKPLIDKGGNLVATDSDLDDTENLRQNTYHEFDEQQFDNFD